MQPQVHGPKGAGHDHSCCPPAPPTCASSMSVFESVLSSVGMERTNWRLPILTTPNPLPRPCSAVAGVQKEAESYVCGQLDGWQQRQEPHVA